MAWKLIAEEESVEYKIFIEVRYENYSNDPTDPFSIKCITIKKHKKSLDINLYIEIPKFNNKTLKKYPPALQLIFILATMDSTIVLQNDIYLEEQLAPLYEFLEENAIPEEYLEQIKSYIRLREKTSLELAFDKDLDKALSEKSLEQNFLKLFELAKMICNQADKISGSRTTGDALYKLGKLCVEQDFLNQAYAAFEAIPTDNFYYLISGAEMASVRYLQRNFTNPQTLHESSKDSLYNSICARLRASINNQASILFDKQLLQYAGYNPSKILKFDFNDQYFSMNVVIALADSHYKLKKGKGKFIPKTLKNEIQNNPIEKGTFVRKGVLESFLVAKDSILIYENELESVFIKRITIQKTTGYYTGIFREDSPILTTLAIDLLNLDNNIFEQYEDDLQLIFDNGLIYVNMCHQEQLGPLFKFLEDNLPEEIFKEIISCIQPREKTLLEKAFDKELTESLQIKKFSFEKLFEQAKSICKKPSIVSCQTSWDCLYKLGKTCLKIGDLNSAYRAFQAITKNSWYYPISSFEMVQIDFKKISWIDHPETKHIALRELLEKHKELIVDSGSRNIDILFLQKLSEYAEYNFHNPYKCSVNDSEFSFIFIIELADSHYQLLQHQSKQEEAFKPVQNMPLPFLPAFTAYSPVVPINETDEVKKPAPHIN